MGKRRKLLPELQGAQAEAVDPRINATLSASAGTGKTQVLTGRVLRLLLSGADPETILCLTFTKAGAAEMANRIGAQLARWVRMPENELKKDLFALGEPDDPVTRQRARRLFAEQLVSEVAESLDTRSLDDIEQELIDLGLHDYCRSALAGLRQSQPAVDTPEPL